jgi:hypothetical protein
VELGGRAGAEYDKFHRNAGQRPVLFGGGERRRSLSRPVSFATYTSTSFTANRWVEPRPIYAVVGKEMQ